MARREAPHADFRRAHPVALPPDARVAGRYAGAFLADAYAIDLPAGATHDALALARSALERSAPWVDALLALRDRLVAGFGIKTAKALRADTGADVQRIGLFRIYEAHDDEVVLGEDDSHLDFRVSMLRSRDPSPGGGARLTAVTVVHCHNLLGRNYIRLIAPFHRLVVRSSLERAARAGWPAA